MSRIQQSVRSGVLRPIRKLGLAAAKRWPWPVAVRLTTGRRMFVDLRSGIGRGIFATGTFDPVVFEPLRRALPAGGTFLDVGANVGFYSMLALDVVGPAGVVHAFEIDERPLRCLRKTIVREHLSNLRLHQIAVGARSGFVGLEMGGDAGLSRVVEQDDRRQVRMTTLDDWWRASGTPPIHAVKLDIEGAELAAVRGATAMLRAERPVIVCEADAELQRRYGYGPPQLLECLTALGYRMQPLPGAWTETIIASWTTEVRFTSFA